MDNTNDSFFQVSIKGLYFNGENKLMFIQEKSGIWELPGGRMQKGESFFECLKRECLEETGLECDILNSQPIVIYPAIDKEGRGRVMVFYKINLKNLNFVASDECVSVKFFSQDEISNLETNPQIKQIVNYL